MPLSSTHLYASAAKQPPAQSANKTPIRGFMGRIPAFMIVQLGQPRTLEILAFLGRPGRRQYFAVAVGLHRGNQAGALHLLDQSRGAVVADPQMSLYQRDRRAAGL